MNASARSRRSWRPSRRHSGGPEGGCRGPHGLHLFRLTSSSRTLRPVAQPMRVSWSGWSMSQSSSTCLPCCGARRAVAGCSSAELAAGGRRRPARWPSLPPSRSTPTCCTSTSSTPAAPSPISLLSPTSAPRSAPTTRGPSRISSRTCERSAIDGGECPIPVPASRWSHPRRASSSSSTAGSSWSRPNPTRGSAVRRMSSRACSVTAPGSESPVSSPALEGLLQPTWTGLGASQFLLGTVDPLDAALAGLRSSDLPTSPPPGRAVRVADRRSVQFAAATGESSGRIAATSEPATDGRGPFVLRPLPNVIRWRDAARRPHAPSRDGASRGDGHR